MQCLYVARALTECLLRRGVCLWRLKMQCLYVSGALTECPVRKSVFLQEVSFSRDLTQ